MNKTIIDNFITLTTLPHCSQDADALFNFLVKFAKEQGYDVQTDTVKNILISKGNPKLALQAHYDMVCMGKAPNIETYVEEGWMYAKDSSLGADNGMAIAMMMSLMEKGEVLEFVLTADEEIGLVGASEIAFELSAQYMLNLDFEDASQVCIGCAGGADLIAEQTFYKLEEEDAYEYNYEVSVLGLDGGHSGVDIDKNIPNAIKVLANYLKDETVVLSSCQGGERRNSIPSNITMKLSSQNELKGNEWVNIKAIDGGFDIYDSDDFLALLQAFEDGVSEYNEEFNLPNTSINLALVSFENGKARVECSSRSMDEVGLESINEENLELFQKHGFDSTLEYKYPAWKPEINSFTSTVNDAMNEVFGKSSYEAIHAGLECGLLLERYPNIKFASIGPTIENPHSTRERVDLESVEKTFSVVEKVIATL